MTRVLYWGLGVRRNFCSSQVSNDEAQSQLRALQMGCRRAAFIGKTRAAFPSAWLLTDWGLHLGGREQPGVLVSASFYCAREQPSNDPPDLVHTTNLP